MYFGPVETYGSNQYCRMSRKCIISTVQSPFANLAFEAALYRTLRDEKTLFLYKNAASVILGLNQNLWAEVKVEAARSLGVNVVRRFSGGGCVYQDLGNVCFSFINRVENPTLPLDTRGENFELILKALKGLGIEANQEGRNDISVGTRKVSGSAFQFDLGGARAERKLLHHGTLLVNTDCEAMGKVLNPHVLKLESKGVKSVQARVANIAELFPSVTTQQIVDSFSKTFLKGLQNSPIFADEAYFRTHPDFEEFFAKISDEKYIFNASRDYLNEFSRKLTKKFAWGLVEANLDVREGKLVRVKFFGDMLTFGLPELIEREVELRKPFYSSNALRRFKAEVAEGVESQELREQFANVLDWMADEEESCE